MQKMFKAIFCDICRRVAFQEQLEGGFQDMLTTQDWVTDWEVTTDFNGFPLRIKGREQRSLLSRLPKELQSDRVQLRRRGAALSQQLRFEMTTV